MEKFIYVFSAESADALIEAGFTLVRSGINHGAYIFENDTKLTFDKEVVKDFILSNTLTF